MLRINYAVCYIFTQVCFEICVADPKRDVQNIVIGLSRWMLSQLVVTPCLNGIATNKNQRASGRPAVFELPLSKRWAEEYRDQEDTDVVLVHTHKCM